jgi:hypothetical protein
MIKEHLLMFNATPLFPFILAVVEFMPDDTHRVLLHPPPLPVRAGLWRHECELRPL